MVTTEHGMRMKLDYLLSRKEEYPRCIASAKPSQHVTRLLLAFPGSLQLPQPPGHSKMKNKTFPRLHQLD
jgi:hypothetical protein